MTYLKLLRVHNYIKNLFVFMPAFFAGQLLDDNNLLESTYAFISFCLISSAVYILNDIRDRKEDALHPIKKNRPIASKKITVSTASIIALGLVLLSLFMAQTVSFSLLAIILIYGGLNIAYSFGLKNIAILDITIISLGFILRIEAGHAATGIEISKWLMIMVFLLSMFQALAKRLDDVHLLNSSGKLARKSIGGYSEEFLQIALSIFSAILLVCYIIYITSPEIEARLGAYAFVSFLPVLLGILRYLQICFVEKEMFDPVGILIRDHSIKILIIIWLSYFGVLLYA